MIKLLWEKLCTTVWFIPTIVSTALVILAVLLWSLDQYLDTYTWSWTNSFRIGTSGIRQVLVVAAGAIISLTGVVFSISVVALTLAATQFGSKILYKFLRDTLNKIVLGLLIGSFLFCFSLLVFIDTNSELNYDIPIISFVGSLLLTVIAIAGLVFFTHRISTTIQADQMIALIGEELNQSIEQTLIDCGSQPDLKTAEQRWRIFTPTTKTETVFSVASGYIEYIDFAKLIFIAEEKKQRFELLCRHGDFVIEGSPVIKIFNVDHCNAAYRSALLSCLSLGRKRTPVNDIEFGIMQLLQIALRALSPGTNDSMTAVSCIDWLSSSIGQMINKNFPINYMEDQAGILRIKKCELDFDGTINVMFHTLRQNSKGNEMIMIHLLEAISRILQVCKRQAYAEVLFHHAKLILETSEESFQSDLDTKEIIKRFEKCQASYSLVKIQASAMIEGST